MRKYLLAGVCLAAVAGCMQTIVETKTPFDPSQGRYVLASGSGAIEGQAFMRQAGGGVVTCAGEEVTLFPATAYQQERMQIIYGSTDGGSRTTGIGNFPPDRDPRAEPLQRTTTCDAEGDFEFRGLAAGDYYVATKVVWMAQYVQGGLLAKRVRLNPGQKVRVLLN